MTDTAIVDENKKARPVGKLSVSQRSYLERGLKQPGGKLPLFDTKGLRIKAQTIRSCIDHGWCEAWYSNPVKPDWLVCRLTETGRNKLIKRTK